MASKSRQRAEKRGKPNQLADLGIFNLPDLDALGVDDGEDSDGDDGDLESELEAILSGKVSKRPSRPKPKAPALDIEAMAADCMKDIDDDEDDENLSNDEELLNELQSLSPGDAVMKDPPPAIPSGEIPRRKPSAETTPTSPVGSITATLEERLIMYKDAIRVATTQNDTSKVRRYGRAVKTLEGLLKSAKAGAVINEEDIPPVVKVPKATPPPPPTISPKPLSEQDSSVDVPPLVPRRTAPEVPPRTAPEVPPRTASVVPSERVDPTLQLLTTRRDQYKSIALQAKKIGDKETALEHLRTVKAFNAVIEAYNNNQPVDLSNIPPPPQGISNSVNPSHSTPKVEQDTHQTSSLEQAALAAAADSDQTKIFDAPPPPSTVLEALQQRLEKYNATKQAAEAEGNSGKVRRLQRIIKQYESAIKDHKAGKPVDYEELPTPPGFGPIPVGPAVLPSSVPPKQAEVKPVEKPANKPPPSTSPREKTENPAANPSAVKKPKVQRTNTTSISEKQLEFLLERQKLFKQAALAAKKNGDIQQAKQYLGMAKGFDSMIEATKCGLPIDTASIPTPPQLESDFVIVDYSECMPTDQSQEELYETLENDLTKQIEVCNRNKDHFLRLGDVSSASKFEKLGLESKKALSVVTHLKKKGDPVPRFHYETRLFSMVQCHTDLSDNELEVTVERGINLPGKPDDLDSYVRIEFPIPAETPQKAKTHTIKDTNNPIFQEEFKFEFNRKSRSQLRHFKRGAIKLEVWSKGGFLRSDSLLGTVQVKLVDLESKCTIHDSFSLKERKTDIGGKLEVKVRMRDPLLAKQVEEVREKWLVVGS